MFEDAALVQMYDAADGRDAAALLSYADNEVAAYRRAFARLVGSMPDSVLFAALAKLLADPIPYVRLEAAWAIGQYRDTIALEVLETTMRKATIPEVKAELLEAIGKCAHPRAMAFLIRHEPNTPVEEAGKMWGVYRATLRGLLEEKHLRVVAAHLSSGEQDTRLAAVHTLARQSQYPLDAHYEALEAAARQDPSAEVRHMAVVALGKAGVSDQVLADIALSDSDPVVRAAAISAFQNADKSPAANVIVDALEDGQPWVAMAAASRLTESTHQRLMMSQRGVALTSKVPEVRAAIVSAHFRLSANKRGAWQLFTEVASAYPDAVSRAVLIKALQVEATAFDTLMAYLRSNPPVSTAAAEALVQGALLHPEWRAALRAPVLATLQEGDLGAVAVFAEAAYSPQLKHQFIDDAEAFRTAAQRFTKPGEFEISNALLLASNKLLGEEHVPAYPAHNHGIDWQKVAEIPRNARAKLYSKGRFLDLQLVVEDAPGSVANFVALAENGFFDGLNFHRIVPGFVSQGGFPAGDGYHSVDYSLRSEFSSLRFGKGVVGMASAGKDTEGCQFFFTHVSTPHLDGRYTIIGAIAEGHDLLYEIGTGAVIDSVRIDK